jgi:hypothetical protein
VAVVGSTMGLVAVGRAVVGAVQKIDLCNNSMFGERQAVILVAEGKSNNLSALEIEKDWCIDVDEVVAAAA